MSEMRQAFEDAAEKLFAAHAGQEVVEGAEQGRFPHDLWRELERCGFAAMLAPESAGGVDADMGDAAAVMRIAGRYAAPGPFLETMLANRVLARAGVDLVAGPVSLVIAEDDALARSGAGLESSATLGPALWADSAAIIIVGRVGARTLICRADSAALRLRRSPSTFTEPRFLIEPAALPDAIADADAPAVNQLLLEAATLNAARMAGALDWCCDRTLAYTGERRQFGRELAKFQAVQQQLAELASETIAARMIADTAAEAAAEAPALVAAARARLGDAVDGVCAIAHQLHGAIGFSREYPLSYRTRRLMHWRDEFGSTRYWRMRLSDNFLGLSLEQLWPALSAEGAR